MKRLALLVALLALVPAAARAEDDVAAVTSEYHTPLAGRPLETDFAGQHVSVPARDRGNTIALTAGTTYFTPDIGDSRFVPFAAIYLLHLSEDRRFRATIAALVNEADYGETVAGGFEGTLHVDNNTIPFTSSEVIDGNEVTASSVYTGTAGGGPGVGFRRRIWPFEIDNELRIELRGEARYFYVDRSSDTLPGDVLPPNTCVYGPHFLARVDCMQRNLMELPHSGFAAGFDASFSRRDRWTDHGRPGVSVFAREDTRDYATVSGYAVAAFGLPFLPEIHRFVLQVHGGTAPYGQLDRFSSFRVGGGPPVTESADLARSPYPAAIFDQFALREFVLASAEYRLEVFFFLYLHFRVTVAWGEVPTLEQVPGVLTFVHRTGETFTFGITTGFVWNSSIYFEYSYDLGLVRGKAEGNTLLLSWSKSF